jgi:hypothetical protein
MPSPYLTLRPVEESYSSSVGNEVIGIALDGGPAMYRRDVIGASGSVTCKWILTQAEYDYFWAFYHLTTSNGALSFYANLILDHQAPRRTEVHFAPGTVPRTVAVRGLTREVQADLEIIAPFQDDAENLTIATTYESALEPLVRIRNFGRLPEDHGPFVHTVDAPLGTEGVDWAMTFDGTRPGRVYTQVTNDGYIRVNDSDAALTAGQPWTAMVWYRAALATATNDPWLWNLGTSTDTNAFLRLDDTGGIFGGVGAVDVGVNGTAFDFVWAHAALAYEPASSGTLYLFQNGILVDSQTTSGTITSQGGMSFGGVISSPTNKGLVGRLDDMIVTRRCLTAADIQSYIATGVIPGAVV